MYTSSDKMDSPVQIPFNSFVTIDKDDANPVYLQITFSFIKAIQLGLLPEGTKLPGTRILCKLIKINRNTLIKAFHELEAQGFIEIFPSRGVFVLSSQKHDKNAGVLNSPRKIVSSQANELSFVRSALLENPTEISDLPLQFNDGMPDQSLMLYDTLARLYVSKLKHHNPKNNNSQLIHVNFKKQLSNFLNLSRNLRISAENLFSTNSHEICLYLIFKILISPRDKVVVAAPSYYLSNMTISDSGAEIISVPVDEDGIKIESLRQICAGQQIKILYLTSVYHYPTTVSLSAKRRIQLLELAEEFGLIIVEDDYEFDFHFDNNPVLPLAALNTNSNVIYVGSLARSLPAGFGYGFVSAPESFIIELEKHHKILSAGVDNIREQVLTSWIENGEIHRVLKKSKKIYRQRRDWFAGLLTEQLAAHIKFITPSRGLAFWIEWADHPNLAKLKKKCAENGLFLPKTSLYQNRNLTATRLGFGNFDYAEMKAAINILANSIKTLNN